MLASILVPLLCAILGLLVFVLAAHPKIQRVGEILLFCGVLVVLFVAAHEVVRI